MIIFRIELGKEVTDNITGYKGIVTARCEYITGCLQYQVTPAWKKGDKFDEGCWMDEDRLVDVKKKKKKKEKEDEYDDGWTPTGPGGPQSNPPRLK